MERIKIALIAPIAALTALLAPMVGHAQLSTSTLGASIDNINGTFYDYFQILLAKFWPFVVGAGILVLVWHFGRRILYYFR